MPFVFDTKTFVQPGYENAGGDWPEEWRKGIADLRAFYPELAHWGDLALGCAFGDFSQDFLEVSWAEWMLGKRDESFLDYCCWRQTRGAWRGGFDEVELSAANNWKN